MSMRSAGYFHHRHPAVYDMLTNAKIKEINKLTDRSRTRRETGLFVIEGTKMFLETPLEWIENIYVTKSFLEDIDRALSEGTDSMLRASQIIEWMDYDIVTDEQMSKISDTKTPQGVLCVLRQPNYDIDVIIKHWHKKNRPGLIVMLEDIQDPGNLGTIMRTAEGAGADGVILSSGCVDIFNPKTIRSTMGSVYRVPFVIADDLKSVIDEIKKEGFTIYAAHLKGERMYSEEEYSNAAFLIGNEGNGLSDEIASCADRLIKIPMEGSLESLNASVAASILMYDHYVRTAH